MRTERLKIGAYKSKELATRAARRVPPPLRFGAALVYVLTHYKPAGRDVGLAKSGFRPTAPRAVCDRSLTLTPMDSRRYRVMRRMIFYHALVPLAWQ
jgi:hypothetical protein